ncbi:DMT family transporter [Comamonas composti]|uniref:DMT family transporter n=1 Tax=Comamonas composti TaxID=408558 RepID=UPI00041142F4|nr:DMT family transporter [Comamonas composti]
MHSPLPVLALLFNAFIWGLSWWPFRAMNQAGLHPLWATALMYGLVALSLVTLRPTSLRQALQYPALVLLAASSGLNNVAFNWAMTVGDVVRVILLFYLMPAWSVLLAWKMLGEKPAPAALLRLLLAFAGVALVLLPQNAGPGRLLAGLSLADALALLGGFMFALTNVLLRRLQAVPAQARMLAMFGGCTLMGAISALSAGSLGLVPGLPAFDFRWAAIALGLSLLLMIGNWALQFGATRLPAGVTAVVMLSEVVFASLSSVLIANESLSGRTLLGGACIMLAALLSALSHARPRRRKIGKPASS